MELRQYLATFWRWSWLIASTTIVAAVFSYWGTSRMPRVYETKSTLMVGQSLYAVNTTFQDLKISQDLANSYVELVRRWSILQATIDALDLHIGWQELAQRVGAAPLPRTQLMEITVSDTDPRRAKLIADELGRQLVLQSRIAPDLDKEQHREFVAQQLDELQFNIQEATRQSEGLKQKMEAEKDPTAAEEIEEQIAALQEKIQNWRTGYIGLLGFQRGYQNTDKTTVSIVEPAIVPTVPVSPKPLLNILLASGFGFVFAAAAALFLESVDDTLKNDEDVQRVLELPTLGTIGRLPRFREPQHALVTIEDPLSPVSEAFRIVRMNVQFSTLVKNQSPALLITSALAGEGKTTTAANLGVVLAQAGKQVILVDADLRQPALHELFRVPNEVGLTTLLLDDTLAADTVLRDTAMAGLRIMPSGPLPPNCAELLGSKPMERRLNEVERLADVILFDSAPVLGVADAVTLGTLCGGVILVADARRTRSDVLRHAKEALERVGLRILGVVLNQTADQHVGGLAYSYSNFRPPAQTRQALEQA